MAALKASEKGLKVVLIEKNATLGQKLLITGGGRCNLTQNELDNKKLALKLGKNGQFLLSALSVFGVKETKEFFENQGLKIKVERGGRIFPVSDKSVDVLNLFLSLLNKNNVEVLTSGEVMNFKLKEGKIEKLLLKSRCREIKAHNFIIATGGLSYPQTGSIGSGYKFARDMGHEVVELRPALVSLKIKEDWPKNLQGLTLKNVEVSLWQNKKKKASRFGEMLFTHFGVSGPIILDLSREAVQLKEKGKLILKIDLKPALDLITIDKRLQRDFKSKKHFKNYLPELLPQKLGNLLIRFIEIDPNKIVNTISKEERKKIINFLKCLPLTVVGSTGFEHALITSGGIDLKEIESKTMRSKISSNLSFAGEILDLDGPTGGYNLQICWTTGYTAGSNSA
ncbi:NAD(P)/FAD-dependent oxidoreductase [Candidatus Parcubacteria bacterium]|nr:NAD(P)/FAD-dependent oxidoreductase [Candidatus Parcubacteria bacterium]